MSSGWVLSLSLHPRNAPLILMDDHGRSVVGGQPSPVGGLPGNVEKSEEA